MCLFPVFMPKLGWHTDDGVHQYHGSYVPCGKCAECLAQRQKEWFTRFLFEQMFHVKHNPDSCTLFITLTYAPEYLPDTREQSVKDIQHFRKQLNYYFDVKRYYFIQEFGDTNNRVHFHGLVFGVVGNLHQIRVLFHKCWGKGRTNVQIVKGYGAFRYVSKYTTKSLNNYAGSPWKPYVSCSQRPALGTPNISAGLRDVLSANPIEYLRSPSQGRLTEPRSWKDRLRTPLGSFSHRLEVMRYIRSKPQRDFDDRVLAQKVFEDKVKAYHEKKRKADFAFQKLQDCCPDEC